MVEEIEAENIQIYVVYMEEETENGRTDKEQQGETE